MASSAQEIQAAAARARERISGFDAIAARRDDADEPASDAGDLRERTPRVATITRRELEVLQLIADDYTNEEIGRQLFLSLQTVKSHAKKIHAKCGVAHRAGAVAVGFREGLLR